MYWNKVYDGAMGWTSELSVQRPCGDVRPAPSHRNFGKPLGPASVESPAIIRVILVLLDAGRQHPGRWHRGCPPIRRAHPRFVENLCALGAHIEWRRGLNAHRSRTRRAAGRRCRRPAWCRRPGHARQARARHHLHGGPGFDHSSFKLLFSRLSDVAQIVYIDHRGHGRSDTALVAEWNLDTFATTWCGCATLGHRAAGGAGPGYGGFVAQRYHKAPPGSPGRSSSRAPATTSGWRASWPCSSAWAVAARRGRSVLDRPRRRPPGPTTNGCAARIINTTPAAMRRARTIAVDDIPVPHRATRCRR